MDEQEQVEQILAAWATVLEEDDVLRLNRMAELAVRALNRPPGWADGDTIADDVHLVATKDGMTFRRGQSLDGWPLWVLQSASILESELLAEFGPVHEVPLNTPPTVAGVELVRSYRADGAGASPCAGFDQGVLATARGALSRAVDVLIHISVKLGVNDAKNCRSAAAGCDRALTALVELAEGSPS